MFCFSVDQLCKCCSFAFFLRLNFLSFVVCYTSLLIGPFIPRESRVALTSWTSRTFSVSAFLHMRCWVHDIRLPRKPLFGSQPRRTVCCWYRAAFAPARTFDFFSPCAVYQRTVPTFFRLSLPLKILARFVYKIFLAQCSSVQNDRDFQPGRMSLKPSRV